MDKQKSNDWHAWGLLFCLLLSALLHVLILWLLQQFPPPKVSSLAEAKTRQEHTVRHLQLRRAEAARPKSEPQQESRKQHRDEPSKHFAKTNPDQAERQPLEADYVGMRNTTAASQPDAAHLKTDDYAPAMEGREREPNEILEQERQEGEISSERKAGSIASPTPPTPPQYPVSQSSASAASQGRPAGGTEPSVLRDALHQGARSEATPAATPRELSSQGTLKLGDHVTEPEPQNQQAAQPEAAGAEEPLAKLPDPDLPRPAQRNNRPVYDPSLPAHAQPGFRTYERRSRSTGTFVMGRAPALNVASTPRGQYEALIYRLIARSWYMACDEHRGDVIPGTLTISVCLNKNGRIHNLQLYGRRGASVLQQSFTFTAIRRASLPPMPAVVQQELKSDLLEMLITFHFD